jgi:hypothetical protein
MLEDARQQLAVGDSVSPLLDCFQAQNGGVAGEADLLWGRKGAQRERREE